jgi:hypothetical protein
VAAGSVSATYAVAREQSQSLMSNPQWFAETGSVRRFVTRDDHELLLRNGAADDTKLQVLRTFANNAIVGYSAHCRRCRRWIWCGGEELEDTCFCGQKYRVVLDLHESKDGTVREGSLCMDCGRESQPREWIDGPQSWNNINGAQVQCPTCFQRSTRKDASAT